MAQDIRDKLVWFSKNLDMQLEDMILEGNQVKVDLYFDTADIRGMVLGMYAIHNGAAFDLRAVFDSDREKPLRDTVLAHCLAASGRLGTIKMLPPHQAEFLNVLKATEAANEKTDYKQLAREFLHEVNLEGAVRYEMPKPDRDGRVMKDAELLQSVRNNVVSAVNLFKTIQLIRGGGWNKRLTNMIRQKWLELDKWKVDYTDIIKSKTFLDLKRALDELRSTRKVNNFADAVALSILISRVQAFRKDRSNPVPRLFVSTPLLFSAVEKAGMEQDLMYEAYDGVVSSALRRADYFVFKCTFLPPPKSSSIDKEEPPTDFVNQEELKKLNTDIKRILNSPEPLMVEKVDKIAFSGKSLRLVIDDLNKFLLYANVWLPSATRDDEQDVLRELHEAEDELGEVADQLQSEPFKQRVDEAIETTKKDLEENVEEYEQLSSRYFQVERAKGYLVSLRKRIDQGADSLHSHVSDRKVEALNFFRDFGLLRFAFPSETHKEITAVLKALLGQEEEVRQDTLLRVTAAYHGAQENPAGHIDALAALTALLWVAEMYDDLIDLLGKIELLPHFSFKLVYAAATFKANKEVEQGKRILNELEAAFSEATDTKVKADLAVGNAYLFHHLWLSLGYSAAWRRQNKPPEQLKAAEGQELIDKAIERAKEAEGLLGDDNLEKKVYSLNQYLLYLVEGAGDDRKSEMAEAYQRLLAYKTRRQVWQYRFDDTIAKYNHRRAVSASIDKEKNKDTLLREALSYVEEAFNEAPWDAEIKSYRSSLLDYAVES
ncbi:MAG TPA: hypothetical protein VKA70_12675 [Blastocatellia bacterium]|nr:hypothetical protein [Blastocatellia bacterium]